MTIQEIKRKVHRNGDTKKYRQILADLNDLPVSVINAVLDDTLIPRGYSISDGEIKKAKKIDVYTPKKYAETKNIDKAKNKEVTSFVAVKEKKEKQIHLELQSRENTIKRLEESIKKQEEKIKFKEKELTLEIGVLKRLQKDIKTEEDIINVLKRI